MSTLPPRLIPARRLRALLLAPFLCLLLCAAAPCPAPPAQRAVAVTLDIAPVEILRAAPPADAFTQSRLDPARSEYAAIGAQAMGSFSISLRTKIEGVAHPISGGHCIWVAGTTATLAYTPRIFISPQSPPCRDHALRTHEMAHIAEDLALAAAWKQSLESSLAGILAATGMHGPMENNQVDAARARIDAGIEAELHKAFTGMMQGRAQRHVGVDSQQVYAAIRAACPQ